MSGYLGRIIGRAREELAVIEPVLGSRYESGPQAPAPDGLELFAEASSTPAAREALPDMPAGLEPALLVKRKREAAPESHADSKPKRGPLQPPQGASPQPSPGEPVPGTAAPARETEPPPKTAALGDSPQVPPMARAEPSAEPSGKAEPSAAPAALRPRERGVVTRIVTVAGGERTRVEMMEFERVVERMAPPVHPHAAGAITVRDADTTVRVARSGREQPQTPAPPEVRVHIGRIEITAPAAPAPAPSPRPRFEAEIGLAAYLEQRRKSGS